MTIQRNANRAFAGDVEAVLAASRVLVGLAAQSVEDIVTVQQLRALMILATRGPLHLTTLADDMSVHPSNATRACDRLVASELLDRRDNPADRRHLLLELTPAGRELINRVVTRRRVAIEKILRKMPAWQRSQLGEALGQFAAAGGEHNPADLWALGWIS